MELLEELAVHCPYCGEVFETAVDWSAGPRTYVEDCPVCCNPIEFRLAKDGAGQRSLEVRRENE